jgi:phosphoribosyl 1,2-cyclic phosphate phosphodiesterase
MFKNAEITFLGTGTSIGVPVIGCNCEVCNSDDPKNKRLRSSIYVRTEETELVVDTGPDFRQQMLREEVRNLDAALFTHAHSDHVMGFDDLRRFTVWDDDELEIFATEECMGASQRCISLHFRRYESLPWLFKNRTLLDRWTVFGS